MSIYNNLLNDKQYKASTGLRKSEFDQLYVIFKDLYKPRNKNPYIQGKQPVLTDPKEALFFILHYFKAYPTLVNMGLYFGFSEKTASEFIELLKPVLEASYQALDVQIPRKFEDDGAFSDSFSNTDEIIIDVTEVEISRPQNIDNQKDNYSGKKKTLS